MSDELIEEVISILIETLQLGGRGAELSADSCLLGCLPELDSMAVITLVTALEEHFGFIVKDDEMVGEVFETVGSLTQFVNVKINPSSV